MSSTLRAVSWFGTKRARFLEPELGDLGEHLPLEGDGIGQHDVERREAIRRDDEQMIGIDVVDVSHLALVNLAQAADSALE